MRYLSLRLFFFFNDTATTEIYTLSLHDAFRSPSWEASSAGSLRLRAPRSAPSSVPPSRSEEHTSELQSHLNLVCRLLLEKKKSRPSIRRSAPPAPPASSSAPRARPVANHSPSV